MKKLFGKKKRAAFYPNKRFIKANCLMCENALCDECAVTRCAVCDKEDYCWTFVCKTRLWQALAAIALGCVLALAAGYLL